jgi:OOP family OmpA-OmpF porin
MKKFLIAVLALIALSIVGWFGVYQMKAPDIQADIQKRVGEALDSNSLDWVTYEVDGRDVTLSGVASNKVMAQHAFETADIYGLNSLNNNITVGDSAGTDSIQATDPLVAVDNQAEAVEETVSDAVTAEPSDSATDVALQEVTNDSIAALPITMNLSKDESGEFIFNGTVPDMELKDTIDKHLVSIGADPANTVWQVELSSADAPKNWQSNILNSISTLHALQDGEVNLSNDQAVVKGVAATQDASDSAEAFAQKIAGDYTTDMNFVIAEAPKAASPVPAPEEVTMVGSDKYAAKFCQTEFNALLKQQKIVFESGSSNLQQTSSALLDKVSQVAVRCPNQVIQVHGYTDSRGAASANWKLSKARAEAVASYLAGKGIEESRLTAIGHGEKSPIATNKTKAGRAKNRRITLIVKGNKK